MERTDLTACAIFAALTIATIVVGMVHADMQRKERTMFHYEIFEGTDGLFYWRKKAANNEITSQSEGYTRKWSAKRAARRDAGELHARIVDLT